MRINSVPDVKCFYNNKNVLRAQSMVWHFVRHPVSSLLHSIHTGSEIVQHFMQWELTALLTEVQWPGL